MTAAPDSRPTDAPATATAQPETPTPAGVPRVASAETMPTLNREEIVELGGILFEHLGAQISLADTKAQVILAADALLASAVVGILDKALVLGIFDAGVPWTNRIAAILAIMTLIALMGSVYYSLLVARPSLPVPPVPNLFYFVSIYRMTRAEYMEKFINQTPHDVHDALFEEIHLLSGLTVRKFQRIAYSINWFVVAFVLWVFAQGLLSLFS